MHGYGPMVLSLVSTTLYASAMAWGLGYPLSPPGPKTRNLDDPQGLSRGQGHSSHTCPVDAASLILKFSDDAQLANHGLFGNTAFPSDPAQLSLTSSQPSTSTASTQRSRMDRQTRRPSRMTGSALLPLENEVAGFRMWLTSSIWTHPLSTSHTWA
ncbi:hypothetical protein FRC08_002024 [Ceratobasidium sp. 394]|nr:hypothetical protein FRC08_002024 [Ceratobasidium sp. 394]